MIHICMEIRCNRNANRCTDYLQARSLFRFVVPDALSLQINSLIDPSLPQVVMFQQQLFVHMS